MFWKKGSGPNKPPASPKKPSREELIAQAKAQVAALREQIGEETLDKVRTLLAAQQGAQKPGAVKTPPAPPAEKPKAPPSKKQPTPAEQAHRLIETMDKEKVADYIRSMSREDKD